MHGEFCNCEIAGLHVLFAIGAAQLIMNSSILVTGTRCMQLLFWNEFVKVGDLFTIASYVSM